MTGRSESRRARWLLVGLVIVAVIALHALEGESANAAVLAGQPLGATRTAAARDVSVARDTSVARDASAAPGITLGGLTSQRYPTFFKISGDARTMTVGAIALEMSCTSGAQFVLQDGFTRVPIRPNGSLHTAFSLPPTSGPGGETYSGTNVLTAHLRRRSQLSGTWRLQLTYSFTNGMSDQCDSGPVRFVATS